MLFEMVTHRGQLEHAFQDLNDFLRGEKDNANFHTFLPIIHVR
jgi:hypothetical protein